MSFKKDEKAVEERPVEERPAEKALELSLAATIAAGLIASANISHREPEIVADLAVKHARALMNVVDKENA